MSPEDLTLRGLRAYEIGRAGKAARVALVLVPVAAVCLLEAEGRDLCACLAAVLLAVAVWLRWRDREGMEAVTTGLLAGALPLLAGVLMSRWGGGCGLAGAEAYCTVGSVIVGALSGLIIPLRETRWRRRFASLIMAALIAALAAAVGCIRLGVVGVASMLLGIVIGSLLGGILVRRAQR